MRQRRLAEAGRADEQYVIKRLAPVLGGFNKYLEIGAGFCLAGKIVQRLRTQRGVDILAALFRGNQSLRIAHSGHSIVIAEFIR